MWVATCQHLTFLLFHLGGCTTLEGKPIVFVFFFCSKRHANCSQLLMLLLPACAWRMTIAWDFMALGDQFFIRSSPLSCHITRLLCAIKILCYGFWGCAAGSSSQLRVAGTIWQCEIELDHLALHCTAGGLLLYSWPGTTRPLLAAGTSHKSCHLVQLLTSWLLCMCVQAQLLLLSFFNRKDFRFG